MDIGEVVHRDVHSLSKQEVVRLIQAASGPRGSSASCASSAEARPHGANVQLSGSKGAQTIWPAPGETAQSVHAQGDTRASHYGLLQLLPMQGSTTTWEGYLRKQLLLSGLQAWLEQLH